jgi:hypothetical protein
MSGREGYLGQSWNRIGLIDGPTGGLIAAPPSSSFVTIFFLLILDTPEL